METATKRRALGRGLGALIPGVTVAESSSEATTVPVSSIRPNPMQPRQTFRQEAVEELAESIKQKGVLQPLLVRPLAGGLYELVAGERRLRAAERAGLTQVPILIREVADDELLELALIENVQREDLNPIEEGRAYKRMVDELGLTQADVSGRVGKDRSTVANAIRLLQLPASIIAQIESGAISAGHARALAGAGSEAAKLTLARRVVAQRLSVRQTEKLARAGSVDRATVDPDFKRAEQGLTETLGTRVRLQCKKGGRGKIEIEYYSIDQLNGLIDRLGRA